MGSWRDAKMPFSEAVYRPWWRLMSGDQRRLPVATRRERWAALYAECRGPEGWAVHVFDAALVASLGCRLAFDMGDCAAVCRLAEEWFAHPGFDYAADHQSTMPEVWSRWGMAEVLLGEVESGLDRFRAFLEDERFGEHRVVKLVGALYHLLELIGLPATADLRVRDFVVQYAGGFRLGVAIECRSAT